MKSQRLVSLRMPGAPTGTNDTSDDVPILSMQDMGGTKATIRRGVELVPRIAPARQSFSSVQRCQPVRLYWQRNAADPMVYSGITAKPSVGDCFRQNCRMRRHLNSFRNDRAIWCRTALHQKSEQCGGRTTFVRQDGNGG
jgi:hypothetical protein